MRLEDDKIRERIMVEMAKGRRTIETITALRQRIMWESADEVDIAELDKAISKLITEGFLVWQDKNAGRIALGPRAMKESW